MDQRIDLTPGPSPRPAEPTSPRKPHSAFGKVVRATGSLFGGPADWFDRRGIAQGASLIRALLIALRIRPKGDPLRTANVGEFDLRATAFTCGLSVSALEARLAVRRRQTAWLAYGAFALGCLFLLAWVWQALRMAWSAPRLVSALGFLPFCVLFFLLAFYNALLNFQIRGRRLASWHEYLVTSESFLPR